MTRLPLLILHGKTWMQEWRCRYFESEAILLDTLKDFKEQWMIKLTYLRKQLISQQSVFWIRCKALQKYWKSLNTKHVMLMLALIGLVGFFLLGIQATNVYKKQKVVHTEHKNIPVMANPVLDSATATKNSTVISPDTRPIPGVLVHTDYIGTPEHPTINGGVLNQAIGDGAPINHDDPDALTSTTVSQPSKLGSFTNATMTVSKRNENFDDGWATDNRVKQLLINAAREGKLDYVMKKTDQMGLPASVAVVPMVESNYESDAISPKGAAGAWQLMPAVAKDYGMSNQSRFVFHEATDTALKLLDQLHQQFGNWTLAFAAYNAGSKRVQDALAKNPKAQNIEELDLPMETKVNVKRIEQLNQTFMALPTHD